MTNSIVRDPDGRVTLTCQFCSATFRVAWSLRHQRFCSIKCGRRSLSPGSLDLTCQHCGGSFTVLRKRRAAKYCSNRCKGLARTDAARLHTLRKRDENGRYYSPDFPHGRCIACGEQYKPASGHQKLCAVCIPTKQARQRYRHYGITEPQWLALLAPFDGKCAICRKNEARYVDHDHATGRVRGGLCNHCNAGLHFMDDGEWMGRAASYLDGR